MGELDAIGEAVTGGMAGRAFEPKAGEVSADGHTLEANCLNCGAGLQGDFCHACGQQAHIHRTLGAFFHDLLHGVLHFEGKTWRTLPLLAWRPGELTRRYIEGERAKFVSPMALFLFTVFIMFAVLSSTLNLGNFNVKTNVDQAIASEQARIDTLERKRSEAAKGGLSTVRIDRQLAEARSDLEGLDKLATVGVGKPKDLELSRDLEWMRGPITHAVENPDLLLYKIRTSAYKWSWALIPLSVPFLWLLFPFSRRFRLYDHVVFVTYSLSFMTLLVVAAAVLYLSNLGSVAGLLAIVPPLHFYRQLKGSYGLTRFGALWRTVALTAMSVVALSIFGTLMLVLGVL